MSAMSRAVGLLLAAAAFSLGQAHMPQMAGSALPSALSDAKRRAPPSANSSVQKAPVSPKPAAAVASDAFEKLNLRKSYADSAFWCGFDEVFGGKFFEQQALDVFSSIVDSWTILVLVVILIDRRWAEGDNIKKLSAFMWDLVDLQIFVMWAAVYFLHVDDKDKASFLSINALCLVPGVALLCYGGAHLFWTPAPKTNAESEGCWERWCRSAANFWTMIMLVNLVLDVSAGVFSSIEYNSKDSYWVCQEGCKLMNVLHYPPFNSTDIMQRTGSLQMQGTLLPFRWSGCQLVTELMTSQMSDKDAHPLTGCSAPTGGTLEYTRVDSRGRDHHSVH
eukprot:TRINITY_DN4800_c0_g2_i1.p1 TRINITY_DN4800_c0_g2~~TRINITY_DN4800_c0_g2_i1.p1  ORF type:complete len:334 (+),score=48.09 TRINITY_DN4800_c0_g2_i1:175-1176(+)